MWVRGSREHISDLRVLIGQMTEFPAQYLPYTTTEDQMDQYSPLLIYNFLICDD